MDRREKFFNQSTGSPRNLRARAVRSELMRSQNEFDQCRAAESPCAGAARLRKLRDARS
jgi:hypothetical protein